VIVVYALHPCDEASSLSALIDEGLIEVVDVTSPGTGSKLCLFFHSLALKRPHPVLIVVVMDAGEVGDGTALRALKVQLSIIVIGPYHIAPIWGKDA